MEKLLITIAVVVFISWMIFDLRKLRSKEKDFYTPEFLRKQAFKDFIESGMLQFSPINMRQAEGRMWRQGMKYNPVVYMSYDVGVGKTGQARAIAKQIALQSTTSLRLIDPIDAEEINKRSNDDSYTIKSDLLSREEILDKYGIDFTKSK